MEIPINPGQIFLIHPRQKHYYRDFTHLTLLTFIFNIEVLEFFISDLMHIETFRKIFGDGQNIQKEIFITDDLTMSQLNILADRLIDEVVVGRPGFRSILTVWLIEVILLIARNSQIISPEQAAGTNKLMPVLNYMEKNYQTPLTLKQLAVISRMSVSNFRRFFKEKIGISPISYLLELRIRKARELLVSSSLSIGDIASQTGFNDTNYFTRMFSQQVGMSPRNYRKEDHGVLHRPTLTGNTPTNGLSHNTAESERCPKIFSSLAGAR
jgi:AraC-like DNA-binding protein